MPPGVRAYSMDLRERIVAAVDAGLTQSQAAGRFGVSLRTVERYLSRRRRGGGPGAAEAGPRAGLPGRRDAVADATLAEQVAAFIAAGGQRVSLSAMSRAISGLPPEPGEQRTPGGRRRRAGRPLKQKA